MLEVSMLKERVGKYWLEAGLAIAVGSFVVIDSTIICYTNVSFSLCTKMWYRI